jgi:hypothetical protein
LREHAATIDVDLLDVTFIAALAREVAPSVSIADKTAHNPGGLTRESTIGFESTKILQIAACILPWERPVVLDALEKFKRRVYVMNQSR